MHPYITIELPAYGICVSFGFVLSFGLYWYRNRLYKYNYRILLVVSIFTLLGMAAGSKLLFFLTKLPQVISDFSVLHTFMVLINSGFVFYGGLLGAVAASALAARVINIDRNKLWSFLAPGFALFHAVGRTGCFLGGCCYGIPWAYGIAMADTPDIKRFPIQLLEAFVELLICMCLLICERKDYQ